MWLKEIETETLKGKIKILYIYIERKDDVVLKGSIRDSQNKKTETYLSHTKRGEI